MDSTSNITSFEFKSQEVRTVQVNNEPWFVAKDVCDILDLSNPTAAIESLDDDERSKFNLGRQGDTNIISESGLYTLIFKSRKPEAKAFRKWVTSEVIPTIRRTGSYVHPSAEPLPPNTTPITVHIPNEISEHVTVTVYVGKRPAGRPRKGTFLAGQPSIPFAEPKPAVMTEQTPMPNTIEATKPELFTSKPAAGSQENVTFRIRRYLENQGGFCVRSLITRFHGGVTAELREAALREIGVLSVKIRIANAPSPTEYFILPEYLDVFENFRKSLKTF